MRKPRNPYPNSIYHIYNQGVNRRIIFRDNEDNQYWIDLLRQASEKYDIFVFCFITMKNHFHSLIETVEPNISEVLWHMGYYYARYINKKYGRVGHLFRNRCQTRIVISPEYFRRVVWYIHYNAVLSGLVENAEEQHPEIHSSYQALVGISPGYSWLAKSRLLHKLDLLNTSKCFTKPLCQKIEKNEFETFTRIEMLNHEFLGLP